MEIKNRKARYNYFILKEIECGIVLTGTEIKSLRKGSADIKDCYAKIKNDEAFLINMYIAKYDEGNRFNHDERRTRKLLLHKTEIKRLKEELACAKKDIKRLMIHDYDVVCEFCSKNKCCYTLNGYDCRDRCNWKGV